MRWTERLAVCLILIGLVIPRPAMSAGQEELSRAVAALQQANSEAFEADKRGDYQTAVNQWERCLEILAADLRRIDKKTTYEEQLYLNIGDAYGGLAESEDPEETRFFNRAIEYYEKIREFVGVNKDDVNLSLCILYSGRGLRFQDARKYERAKVYHEKALGIITTLLNRDSKSPDLEARERGFLGITEWQLGNYRKARSHFDRALELWEAVKGEKKAQVAKSEALIVKGNIAGLQVDAGEFSAAKETLRRLIKAYGAGPSEALANAHLNLGKCFYILGNFKDAETSFLKARETYALLDHNEAGIGLVDMNMGLMAFKQGLYHEAEGILKKVAESPDRRIRAMALSSRAIVLIALFKESGTPSLLKSARESLQEAESIARGMGDRKVLMAVRDNLGVVYGESASLLKVEKRQGKADEEIRLAEEAFDEAYQLGRQLTDQGASSSYVICNILSDRGDLALRKAGAEGIDTATKYFSESLDRANKLYPEQRWYAYYGLARAYRMNGDVGKAIENLKSSVRVIEEMRNLMGGKGQIGFLRDKHQVYTDLIDLLLSQWEAKGKRKYADEALVYLEKSRLGAIRNLFEQALPKRTEGIQEKLAEIDYNLNETPHFLTEADISRLELNRTKLEKSLERDDLLLKKGQVTAETLREVIKAMDQRQVMLQFYYNDKNIYVWKYDKTFDKPRLMPPIKREYLDEETFSEGRLIKDGVEHLYGIISDEGTITEVSGADDWIDVVHKELFMPLGVTRDRYDRITIIPYGKLALLPFSVLGDKKRRLVDDYTVHYFFSATQQLVAKTPPKGGRLFAVGNPEIPAYLALASGNEADRGGERPRRRPHTSGTARPACRFKEAQDILKRLGLDAGGETETRPRRGSGPRRWGFEKLADAGKEVSNIKAGFVNPTAQHDDKIEESFVRAEMTKNYNYLHFATHGFLVNKNPLDSFILFSEGDPGVSGYDSGLLTVKEIRKDLSGKLSDVRLAVLSACQTSLAFTPASRTDPVPGLELATLSAAFQSAGANTVIASLWEVSSEATALFMNRFYHHHIAGGQPIAKALQLAKREFREGRHNLKVKVVKNGKAQQMEVACSNEFFWAPFIVLGNPN